jgi:hypothetical protein
MLEGIGLRYATTKPYTLSKIYRYMCQDVRKCFPPDAKERLLYREVEKQPGKQFPVTISSYDGFFSNAFYVCA